MLARWRGAAHRFQKIIPVRRVSKEKEKPSNQRELPAPSSGAADKRIEALFAAPPTHWTPEQQVFLMRALRQLDLLPERALNRLLSRLIDTRHLDLVRSVVDDTSLGFETVRGYYHLCLALYLAEDVQLDSLFELYRKSTNSFLYHRILDKTLTCYVKFGAIDRIQSILAELEASDYVRLNKATKLGILNLLIRERRFDAASRLLQRSLEGADEILRIQYLDPIMTLDKLNALRPDLKKFCLQVRSSASATALHSLSSTYIGVDAVDRTNFNRHIIMPLRNILSAERNLMDVRFSDQQKQTFTEQIRLHIMERHPLSMVRLGDGEAYAYKPREIEGIDSSLFLKDNEIRERHWWGSHPSPQIRADIIKRVRDAVENCDILGIPSVYRVARDLPKPGQRYGEGRSQRGLLVVLNACNSIICPGNKFITEERCHQAAIDETTLNRFASVSKSVVVVSCWAPGQLHLPFPAEYITVPAPQKLKRLNSDNSPPLFQTYPKVLAQLREVAGPGVFVLVGAGIIGKFLIEEARECGAVAIDVGSMLDYTAGSKTRSVADMI